MKADSWVEVFSSSSDVIDAMKRDAFEAIESPDSERP